MKYFLLWSGEEGIEISSTWDLSNTESNTLSVYWERFEKYVAPKSNFRIARYKLRSLKQDNGESVDAFMKNVRLLARECKYENTNEHMLDTLIFGTNSEYVQSKLIQRDETLTLDEAIDVARTAEATKQQLNSIRPESAIHAISNDRQQAKRRPWQYANHRDTPRDGRYSRNTCTVQNRNNSTKAVTVVTVVENAADFTAILSTSAPHTAVCAVAAAKPTTGKLCA